MNYKKIFVPIVLLLAVVILPLGSWYYLDSGLEYRKNIQKEITSYIPMDETNVLYNLKNKDGSSIDWNTLLEGYTSVVFKYDKNIDHKIISFQQQFRKTDKFQIICLSTNQEKSTLGPNVMVQNFPKGMSQAYLFNIDKKMIGAYLMENNGMKKLIEHTAVVIPRIKEKDIMIKKTNNE